MLETVGFPTQGKAFRMVKYPVKHGGGKHRVSHHLSPLRNLLVGGKDDGGRLIGVTDESEEAVRLRTRYRCVADFVDDNQLRFLQVLQPEAGGTLCVSSVHDTDQVTHLLEADGIACLDGIQSQSDLRRNLEAL